jgi:Nuclease-related domain
MSWEFIAVEFLNGPGEEGERLIWEKICQAYKDEGEGFGFLNYTDYLRENQKRYQPDILLVSRDWGLAVIEVKSCRIDQIVAIRANQWQMRDFYADAINPNPQSRSTQTIRCHSQAGGTFSSACSQSPSLFQNRATAEISAARQ